MIRMMKGGNYRNIDDKLVCVFDVVNVQPNRDFLFKLQQCITSLYIKILS